jgi:aspartate racemase
MKTIGLIGGMGWEASAHYYRRINELVHAKLNNMASAQINLISLNNRLPAKQMYKNQWPQLLKLLEDAAHRLQASGIDCLALACNSVHHIANDLEAGLDVPFIHIADAVGEEAQSNHHKKLALLGTKFTCGLDFYQERLKKFDLEVVLPPQAIIDEVHLMIYEKLKNGRFPEKAQKRFLAICRDLPKECDGIILGCTELPLLVEGHVQEDLFFYDTIELHCRKLADFSLN